jgi:anti-anti-sigma factor
MGIQTDKQDEGVIVAVEEELTISSVAKLKEILMDEAGQAEKVTIDLETVQDMDVSGLQLLCSTNRHFEKTKKKLVLKTGTNTEFFKSFLIESGYDPSGGCPESPCRRCLWKGDLKNG